MWAFSIDDRTLLCLAVYVTKHSISNFGKNNFKFSKTVAYITYIVFQCSLSQGYVTLNRGFSSLWVRVCFLPPRSFRWAWHGMVDVFLAEHKSQSARNSRCISTVVAYFPTQNSARGLAWACNNLPFLFSFCDRVVNVDLHQYHDVWMPRYGFLQNRHLFWPAVLREMYFWCKA